MAAAAVAATPVAATTELVRKVGIRSRGFPPRDPRLRRGTSVKASPRRRRAALPSPALGDDEARIGRVREPDVTTLPGGERVVTDRLRGVRSVALGLWIGTGSRDEPRSRAGVSHFIEHLLFKLSLIHI